MPRYIDADKIEPWFNREDHHTPDERWRPESEFAWIIDHQPTAAEASEIRTGRWVYYPRPHYFKCSKCRCTVPYKKAALIMGEREYAFCPHCGARMDGEE